jgi:hypothetical protein
MKISSRTFVAVIGAVALLGALSLPTAASATVTGHGAKASPLIDEDFFIGWNGAVPGAGISATGAGDVLLSGASDVFENIAQESYDGHTYYEYKDVVNPDNGPGTGLCLQATVGDTFMAEGGCEQVTRQFWFYNGMVLVNRAFGSKAKADGTQVSLGFGTGADYQWSIIET